MNPRSLTGLDSSEIDWYSFLARPRLHFPTAKSGLREACILVTGAGGSIGSAIALKLAALHPRSLVLLDSSEQALYRLQSGLGDSFGEITTILGSTTDPSHLDEIFANYQPTIVFHAAAFKHLPLLESQLLAALANNALGTHTLAQCAQRHGTPRLVLLSTDKAVDPASILGASKRIAEQIILASSGVVVRLGNVLGTAGSVVEVFLTQIRNGGPITITDPQAERYFLTCEEAVDLLLYSAIAPPSASLLVPSLSRAHSIAALARFLIEAFSPNLPQPFVFTGPRSGDKPSESLWSAAERAIPDAAGDFLRIESRSVETESLNLQLTQLEHWTQQRDTARVLEIVQAMVPNFTPGETLLSYTRHSLPKALQS